METFKQFKILLLAGLCALLGLNKPALIYAETEIIEQQTQVDNTITDLTGYIFTISPTIIENVNCRFMFQNSEDLNGWSKYNKYELIGTYNGEEYKGLCGAVYSSGGDYTPHVYLIKTSNWDSASIVTNDKDILTGRSKYQQYLPETEIMKTQTTLFEYSISGGTSATDINIINLLLQIGTLTKSTETITAGTYYSVMTRATQIQAFIDWMIDNGEVIWNEKQNIDLFKEYSHLKIYEYYKNNYKESGLTYIIYDLSNALQNASYYAITGDLMAFNSPFIELVINDNKNTKAVYFEADGQSGLGNATLYAYEDNSTENIGWTWENSNAIVFNIDSEVLPIEYDLLINILDYNMLNPPYVPPVVPPEPIEVWDDIWDFLQSLVIGLAPILEIKLFGLVPIGWLIAIPVIFAILAFVLGLFK